MRTDIEKTICKKFSISKLPERILIEEKEGSIYLNLKGDIKGNNMQTNSCAFEGWAIVSHLCNENIDVILEVDQLVEIIDSEYINQGHWVRFLYRALRFKEQYEWFKLSPKLETEVDKFSKYINKTKLVNNYPQDKATESKPQGDKWLEKDVETMLEKNNLLNKILDSKIGNKSKIYRQLPVGLFVDDIDENKDVFTCGHSAIDLWSINGNTINVVELKTKNRMIGIVTEIFFYTNYIYDFISNKTEKKGFVLSSIAKEISGEKLRGYDEIIEYKSKIKKVNGIMLYDDNNIHPCVTREVVEVLNQGKNTNLHYYLRRYKLEIEIKPIND